MSDNIDLEKDKEIEENVKEEMENKEEKELEGLATELLHTVQENNRRLVEVIKTIVKSFAITVIVVVAMFLGLFLYFVHNFEVESYYQDGNGYNNINTGIQGDLYNGTEIPED